MPYKKYKITFNSNPEYPPVNMETKTFSVPSDITSIDEVNQFITDITGVFIIKNWGEAEDTSKIKTSEVKYIEVQLKNYNRINFNCFQRKTRCDNEPYWVQRTYGCRHDCPFINQGWAELTEEGILVCWVAFAAD